jgi:hypothetical protein
MIAWWEELDEPPTPEQVEFWSRVRAQGRRRYIGRRVLRVSLLWLAIWLLSAVIATWGFGKTIGSLSYALLPVGPVVGWMIFRERWRKNEQRFLAAR